MKSLVEKSIHILFLILLSMANTFAMDKADNSIGLSPKWQLHKRCACASACGSNKWCFVDPDQCFGDIESEVFEGYSGFWRKCDPNEESTKAQKETSSLSWGETAYYYAKKIPESWENAKKEAQVMINTGRAAQTYKSNPRKKSIRISDLIMYHPVRGETARPTAIESLDKRVTALEAHWNSIFKGKYEKQEPITLDDLKLVTEMKSKDEIQVVEFRTSGNAHPEYIVISGQGRVQAMMEAFPNDLTITLTVFDLPLGLCKKVFDVRNNYIDKGQLLDVKKNPIAEKKAPASCAAPCPGDECGFYGAGYFPIALRLEGIGLDWKQLFYLRSEIELPTISDWETRHRYVRQYSRIVRNKLIYERNQSRGTFRSIAQIIALEEAPESILLDELSAFADHFRSMKIAERSLINAEKAAKKHRYLRSTINKKKTEYEHAKSSYLDYKSKFRELVLKKYENLPFSKK